MISIGDVCPLFFKPLKYKYSNAGCFRQVFSVSDNILLQIFCDNGEKPSAYLNDKIGNISSKITLLTYDVNESIKMYYASLSPSEGIYTVTIGDKECEEFCVCENIGDSILIEYSHKDNNSAFDNIFWIDEVRQMFQFRIIGGFKPDGVELKVENEQFVNQKQEIIEMYSLPYKTFDFVFGTSSISGLSRVPGVPSRALHVLLAAHLRGHGGGRARRLCLRCERDGILDLQGML